MISLIACIICAVATGMHVEKSYWGGAALTFSLTILNAAFVVMDLAK